MTLLLFVFWYMVGSILPALYIGKSKGIDMRDTGSGNPGARNAGRVFGKFAFMAVLLLDMAKGAVAVLVSRSFGMGPTEQLLMLLAVMLGHCFPLFHRFRGGKGAASLSGGLLAFQPLLIVPVLLLAVVLYVLIRQKTKAAVLSIVAVVPVLFIWGDWTAGVVSLCLFALLLVTHRSYLTPSQGRMRM